MSKVRVIAVSLRFIQISINTGYKVYCQTSLRPYPTQSLSAMDCGGGELQFLAESHSTYFHRPTNTRRPLALSGGVGHLSYEHADGSE